MAIDFLPPSNQANRYCLSTAQFAEQQLVEPQTVRKRYSVTGSYHGVRPLRLPNRRLLWPDDTIADLAAASSASHVTSKGDAA